MVNDVHGKQVKQRFCILRAFSQRLCRCSHELFRIPFIVEFDQPHRYKTGTSPGVNHLIQNSYPGIFPADCRQVFRTSITRVGKSTAGVKVRGQFINKVTDLPRVSSHAFLVLFNYMPDSTAA